MSERISQMVSLRLSEQELERVDAIVASGAFRSRSAALKHGLFLAWKEWFNASLVAEFKEAYERIPETDEERRETELIAQATMEEWIAEDPDWNIDEYIVDSGPPGDEPGSENVERRTA